MSWSIRLFSVVLFGSMYLYCELPFITLTYSDQQPAVFTAIDGPGFLMPSGTPPPLLLIILFGLIIFIFPLLGSASSLIRRRIGTWLSAFFAGIGAGAFVFQAWRVRHELMMRSDILQVEYHAAFWNILGVYLLALIWNGAALAGLHRKFGMGKPGSALMKFLAAALSVGLIVYTSRHATAPLYLPSREEFRMMFQAIVGLAGFFLFTEGIKNLIQWNAPEEVGSLPLDFSVTAAYGVFPLLGRTFRTCFIHPGVITKIVIPIFLPAELLLQYLILTQRISENMTFLAGIRGAIELVCGSLTIPALMYAFITVFRTGTPPSLCASLKWGFRQWGKMTALRLLVSATIGMFGNIGFFVWIFLVKLMTSTVGISMPSVLVIMSGVIVGGSLAAFLAVNAVFIEAVIGIEGDAQEGFIRIVDRSERLTKGLRWMLFFSGLSLLIILVGLGLATGIFLSIFDHWLVAAVLFCGLDVLSRLLSIMFFLAYLMKVKKAIW